MSYHARIAMPLLIVTGRTGALGKMKRGATLSGRRNSGTKGTKSVPSAPSPCSQMTLAVGGDAGVITMVSGCFSVGYFIGESKTGAYDTPGAACWDARRCVVRNLGPPLAK